MPNVSLLLERQMPPEMLRALKAAGGLAGPYPSHAREAYLVGGPVRDLYLGTRPVDLDIAVVGDGPAFAGALAPHVGGGSPRVSEFGTASIDTPFGRVDVATARTERYAAPASLPEVTPAGIQEDLARRDFTVNAIAVAITPGQWGEVINPIGGVADIARRRLRVLHEASFQEDPTRILRGLRYNARLGFNFDRHTGELIIRHTRFIDLLSPARLLAEFRRMLAEPLRAKVFKEAEVWGVLRTVSPALHISPEALAALGSHSPGPGTEMYDMALICADLSTAEALALSGRLDPPSDLRDVVIKSPGCRAVMPDLDRRKMLPSEVAGVLSQFPVPVLEAQRDTTMSERPHQRLSAYIDAWRHIRPECTGEDLLHEGVPPGPPVGALLQELKAARLDGKVHSKEGELKLVSKRVRELQKAAAR